MKTQMIQQHEEEYTHIHKGSILAIAGAVLFAILAYLNLYFIDWDVINLVFSCKESECSSLVAHNLINIYPLVGEYVLISLLVISLAAISKGGYSRLKSFDEEGLIMGLISGLITGLIVSLIWSLIVSLIWSLIVSLIAGLIMGLIFGLIAGLIAGLKEEFN